MDGARCCQNRVSHNSLVIYETLSVSHSFPHSIPRSFINKGVGVAATHVSSLYIDHAAVVVNMPQKQQGTCGGAWGFFVSPV